MRRSRTLSSPSPWYALRVADARQALRLRLLVALLALIMLEVVARLVAVAVADIANFLLCER